jgi:hypothetical protein
MLSFEPQHPSMSSLIRELGDFFFLEASGKLPRLRLSVRGFDLKQLGEGVRRQRFFAAFEFSENKS